MSGGKVYVPNPASDDRATQKAFVAAQHGGPGGPLRKAHLGDDSVHPVGSPLTLNIPNVITDLHSFADVHVAKRDVITDSWADKFVAEREAELREEVRYLESLQDSTTDTINEFAPKRDARGHAIVGDNRTHLMCGGTTSITVDAEGTLRVRLGGSIKRVEVIG